jgi:hypothetical protein
MWKMFLDDERWPKEDGWRIVRCSFDAKMIVEEEGMPVEIAFDHDLGVSFNDEEGEYFDTSMRFIHWMIEQHYDHGLVIPEGFRYTVHSQNPIGAHNIKELMDGFLKDIGRA